MMRKLAAGIVVVTIVMTLTTVLWLGTGAADAMEEPRRGDSLGDSTVADTGVHPPSRAEADPATPLPTADPSAPPAARTVASDPPSGATLTADDPLGATISGTVRRPDGTGAAAAEVIFTRGGERLVATTSANGAYAVVGPRPGKWTVLCRATGCAAQELVCDVDASMFQTLDLTLRDAFVMPVKLVDADGQPLAPVTLPGWPAGAPWVLATETPLSTDLALPPPLGATLGEGQWHSLVGRDGRLPASGHFGELRLRRPPPLHVTLLVRGVRLRAERITADQAEVRFVVEPSELAKLCGRVRARLVDATTGQPLVGVVARLGSTESAAAVTSDPQGEVVWNHVAPGWQQLEVPSTRGLERVVRTVSLPARGHVELGDIPLAAELVISGTVLGPNGLPVAAGHVRWADLDGWRASEPWPEVVPAPIAADGTFRIRGGRHRYVLVVHNARNFVGFAAVDARQGTPEPVTVTLASATRVALRGELELTSGYSVTASTSDGTPVAIAMLGPGGQPDPLWLPPGTYQLESHDLSSGESVRKVTLELGSMAAAFVVR